MLKIICFPNLGCLADITTTMEVTTVATAHPQVIIGAAELWRALELAVND